MNNLPASKGQLEDFLQSLESSVHPTWSGTWRLESRAKAAGWSRKKEDKGSKMSLVQ
jgi:hypothetical protein